MIQLVRFRRLASEVHMRGLLDALNSLQGNDSGFKDRQKDRYHLSAEVEKLLAGRNPPMLKDGY